MVIKSNDITVVIVISDSNDSNIRKSSNGIWKVSLSNDLLNRCDHYIIESKGGTLIC